MRRLFTSDLHFFHNNITTLCNRPWTKDDNNQALIDIWNENVRDGDVVYNLGDMFFRQGSDKHLRQALDILEQLNGKIVLIKGNHDNERLWNRLQCVYDLSINLIEVVDYKEININGTKVCMSHYPIVSWNQMHRGSWMLHGHLHGSQEHAGKIVDVGLDAAPMNLGQYRFWTEQDVEIYMNNQDVFTQDHHKT